MDTTEILIKIRKIVRSINIESKKIQKEYGVSIPQVLCLNYLKNSDNYQATQGELRKFLNLNSSTISGIINRLEIKGLVARLPRQGDKRIVNIALTSKGDLLLQQIPSLLQVKLSERLDKLDNKIVIQIFESLEFLVNLLDINDIEAFPSFPTDDIHVDINNRKS
ncbi:MAG: MarR family transcriptional regulator [Bacteroidales bacterium]|nr:MarR family transcriptional regulator [Bacteroidales bacterium]